MNDFRLSIYVLVGFLSLKAVIHFLGALSKGHGVFICLVLAVLLDFLDVCVNLLSKEELCHFLVDFFSCGWDSYCEILLTL